jgi:hypothetical protein
MFLIPLKLKVLITVVEQAKELLLMLITSMELTEISKNLEIELSSSLIEQRDVILSLLNLNNLVDIMKN